MNRDQRPASALVIEFAHTICHLQRVSDRLRATTDFLRHCGVVTFVGDVKGTFEMVVDPHKKKYHYGRMQNGRDRLKLSDCHVNLEW